MPVTAAPPQKALFRLWRWPYWWLIVVGGLGLVVIFFWKISSVECQHRERPCSAKEVAQVNSALGKRVLFSNWRSAVLTQVEAAGTIVVQQTAIRWPATAQVSLVDQHQAFQVRVFDQPEVWAATENDTIIPVASSENTQVQTIWVTPEKWQVWQADSSERTAEIHVLQDIVATLQTQDVRMIELYDSQLLAVQIGEQWWLSSLGEWNTDWQRWELIQKGFDSSSISAPVVEVDTRYNLPVLRITSTLPRHKP